MSLAGGVLPGFWTFVEVRADRGDVDLAIGALIGLAAVAAVSGTAWFFTRPRASETSAEKQLAETTNVPASSPSPPSAPAPFVALPAAEFTALYDERKRESAQWEQSLPLAVGGLAALERYRDVTRENWESLGAYQNRGVDWKAWKTPHGVVVATGPFCPADGMPLRYEESGVDRPMRETDAVARLLMQCAYCRRCGAGYWFETGMPPNQKLAEQILDCRNDVMIRVLNDERAHESGWSAGDSAIARRR